jgi:hypothetical protein
MQTWEYGTLVCRYQAGITSNRIYWSWRGASIEVVSLEHALDLRGSEGWELVTSFTQVEPVWTEQVFVFKRHAPAAS